MMEHDRQSLERAAKHLKRCIEDGDSELDLSKRLLSSGASLFLMAFVCFFVIVMLVFFFTQTNGLLSLCLFLLVVPVALSGWFFIKKYKAQIERSKELAVYVQACRKNLMDVLQALGLGH